MTNDANTLLHKIRDAHDAAIAKRAGIAAFERSSGCQQYADKALEAAMQAGDYYDQGDTVTGDGFMSLSVYYGHEYAKCLPEPLVE